MPKHASSGQYAIVGLGVVAGPQQDHSERMVAAEAARLAIEDAGLTPKDIDGAIDLRRTGGGGDRATYVDAYSRLLGLNNCFYFVVGRGGALAGLGIATALSFLDRGIANYICIMGAVTDWSQAQESRKAGHRGMAHAEKAGYWGKALGDLRAVSHHSWMAARHMAVYGTTSRQLGAISVAQRAWACKNPEAKMYGRPMTIEDHQNSPLVAEPYRLLDISLVSDGGVAFILTTADRAKNRPEAAGLRAGPGLRRGVVGAVVGEEEFHPHGGAARQAAGLRAGRPRRSPTSTACSSTTASPPRCCFSSRTTASARRARAAPSWNRAPSGPAAASRSTPAAACSPAITSAISPAWRKRSARLRGEAGERQIEDCDVVMTTGHGGELISPGMCSIHTCTLLGRHP